MSLETIQALVRDRLQPVWSCLSGSKGGCAADAAGRLRAAADNPLHPAVVGVARFQTAYFCKA